MRTISPALVALVILACSLTGPAHFLAALAVPGARETSLETSRASGVHPWAVPAVTAPMAEMLALINAERVRAGAHPLRFDGTLNAIAQARSQDMVTRHYFSHQIPGVPGVHLVFDILDHDNVPYQMAGENLARNNYSEFYPMTQTIELTNADLMTSPEHRANILEPAYAHIGIGMVFDLNTGFLVLTEVFVQP